MRKIIIGIVALVAAIMPAYPAQAVTTFPGTNSAIAFTEAAHGSVMTFDPASGERSLLLKVGSREVTWTPGGKRLAYARDGRIFVANARGKTIYRVPRGANVSDSLPQWSSDGKKLAFVRTRDGRSAVYVVRFGHMSKNISGWSESKSYRSPSWSPDGRSMVYEEYSASAARLLVNDLAARSVRELTSLSNVTSSSQASWSPSGKKILYRDSAQELYTIWPDGTHRAVISDGESYSGSWSPDGANIAFIEAPNDDHMSVSEADGTVRWIPIDKGAYDQLGAPVWSPDGTKLAFTLMNDMEQDIFMLDVVTGQQSMITKNVGAEMLSWRAVTPRR